MRIPTGLFSRNFLSYIEKDSENIFWNNQRIASTKRIQLPSDDPMGTTNAIKLNNNITFNDQYIENTNDAISWLNSTEVGVNHLLNLLTNASVIATQGMSEVVGADARVAMGNEINQILEEMVATADNKVKGKYIFGGLETQTLPYTVQEDAQGRITDVIPNPVGISGEIKRKISEEEIITINISGDEIFDLGAGTDTFDVLIGLRDALYNNDSAGIETYAQQLESSITTMRRGIETIGSKLERLNTQLPKLDALQVERKAELSKIMDTDMAVELVELQKNQTVLQSVLQTGARIMGMSLMDFIT
jgi:flagellar hook-associated protein 3 FlgL